MRQRVRLVIVKQNQKALKRGASINHREHKHRHPQTVHHRTGQSQTNSFSFYLL